MKFVLFSALLLIAGVVADKESAEVSSQKPDIVNWLPVSDSDQKPGDYQNSISNVYPSPTLSLFPRQSDSNLGSCDAPNGLGMSNLFRQAKGLLPRQRIRNIIQGAFRDPQVQAVYQLVRTPEYRQRAANFSRSREYNAFRRFACYRMNCDVRLYKDFVGSLLPMSALGESSEESNEVHKGRPGWRGVLADIRDALPRQQLRNLFERLWATDRYLRRAVQTAGSSEFQTIFRIVLRNPDYMIMSRALADVGFPIEELKKLTYIALGWRENAPNGSDDLFTER